MSLQPQTNKFTQYSILTFLNLVSVGSFPHWLHLTLTSKDWFARAEGGSSNKVGCSKQEHGRACGRKTCPSVQEKFQMLKKKLKKRNLEKGLKRVFLWGGRDRGELTYRHTVCHQLYQHCLLINHCHCQKRGAKLLHCSFKANFLICRCSKISCH